MMILAGIDPFSAALIGILISGAVSFGASLLMAPRKSKVADNSAPVLTERGSALPLVIGRRRLPGFLCWAGDRKVSSTGGGGKGLGSSAGGQNYAERGWHVLCVGPVTGLHAIYENGKAIWTGNITPDDSPSGTHIHTKKGEAYIYWGEFEQPVDPVLSVRLGTVSCWPCICYIFWNRKQLGGLTQWPQVEYEISVAIMDVVLENSPAWLAEGTPGDGTDGPNPAHVLWQILTGPAPYGCAIPPERLAAGEFEALGQLMETEHQSCHVLSSDMAAADLVGNILQDLGVMLPQIGDVIVPVPVRLADAGELPVVTDDMLVIPAPPPRRQIHEAALPDRLTFVIKDRTNNFRDMDIVVDDDSQASLRNRTRQQRVDIPTVIDRRTALLVAKRRELELLTNTERYSLEVAGGAQNLWPGQAFILSGYGQLRVGTVERDIATRTARIEAVIDQYSGEPGTYVPADIGDEFSTGGAAATTDTLVLVQEAPYALSATPALAVLRVRSSDQVSGAAIWVSADDTSYALVGSQDAPAAGGTLQTAMPADGPAIIEQGPVITTYNADIQDVLDLSGNEDGWRTGAQLAVIGDEIFFLRNVTAVDDGWRLDGLIRARFDTDREAHAVDAPVAIITATSLKAFPSRLIRAGSTVYVKSQPSTSSDTLDLSTVTPVTLTIGSPRSLRPLPPDNFVANRGPRNNEFTTGADVHFTWTYRVKDGQGNAADEVGAGVAIGADAPAHEGKFRIVIRDLSDVVKRTILVDDDTGACDYLNATLATDFGAEPASFTAELANVSGSYESTRRLITVTRI